MLYFTYPRSSMTPSYDLWSLLEMLKVGTTAFTRAVHHLAMLRGSYIMQFISGGEAARTIVVSDEQRVGASASLATLREQALILGGSVTVRAIDRLDRLLKEDKGLSLEDMSVLIEQIETRLFDELETRHVFVLDQMHATHFDGLGFGPEVAAQFPSAAFDLDEAGKCLALSRSTAAVFHLMRVSEIALHAVHSCLGITTPLVGNDRNWGKILNRIRDNINGRKNFMENDLFQEIYALIDAIKDAWRNATMHVEHKKTEEEAEVILICVRALMKKLAARMDENGQPLA